MRVTNFTDPIAIVQTISIYNCLNILGDFFYKEGILFENEVYEPIPTANGLCEYLRGDNDKQERALHLSRELLKGTDLYGENGTEIPDSHFVNTLFDHIMGNLIFAEHIDVYGFLARILRSSDNSSLENIFHDIKNLLNAELKNIYGPDTSLNSCSRERIFKGLIEPLFPNPGGNPDIFSVDYIYALAGSSFLRSGWINSGYFLKENSAAIESEHPDEVVLPQKSFDEYIAVGQAIKQLVISGLLDTSALRIFALPALLHYVYGKKPYDLNSNRRAFIGSRTNWKTAYQLLFSNLNTTVENMQAEKATIFRNSILTTLKLSTHEWMEAVDLSKLFKEYTFDPKITLVNRFSSPGFELFSDIGEAGLRSIEELVETIGKQFFLSFDATKQTLERSRKVLANPIRKIGEKFGTNVYVHTLSSNNDSGYGYKFIYLPDGTVAELRSVHGFEGDVPVVYFEIDSMDEEIYRTIDPTTKEIIEKDLYVKNNEIGPKVLLYLLKVFRRNNALNEEKGTEDGFIKTAANKLRLEHEEIRKVLRSYVFIDDGSNQTRRNFMNEWLKYGTVPEWSEEYKIEEPEVFHNLMYLSTFEQFRQLDVEKGREIIRKILVEEKLISQIEGGFNNIKDLVRIYLKERHYYEVNFEDYFALRNYGNMGSARIGESTDEGRRMQMAFYRLAIRQSEDPLILYTSKLYRGTWCTMKHIEELLELKSSGENYVFGRFISTSRNENVAGKFSNESSGEYGPDSLSLIYEMKFPEGRYPRARIEEMALYATEEETVLLPGTEFRVEEIILKNETTPGYVRKKMHVRVVMEYVVREKYRWQQNFMKRIKELKNSGTKFFHDDSNMNLQSVNSLPRLNITVERMASI